LAEWQAWVDELEDCIDKKVTTDVLMIGLDCNAGRT
jgi:hypothetical protein